VDGPFDVSHSTRSELAGLTAPLLLVRSVLEGINLKRKHGWSKQLWNSIDITAFGRYFKTLSGAKRVQHMKFVHNLQPLGVHQAKLYKSNQEVVSRPIFPRLLSSTASGSDKPFKPAQIKFF
jgi:hypothetical protein